MSFSPIRVIDVMIIKHVPPRANGLEPDFTSFTMSLLKPMADIAITMKNLDRSLKGLKYPMSTPLARAMVVIRLAIMKYIMKNGNICLMDIFLLSSVSVFFILMKARPRHIGIMARVLVSLTVTASSRVWLPRLKIVSHVYAVAVTDDVSFTADPANIPKA